MLKMVPIRYVRNIFLRAMCVVYLFAFISFYIQIPGLYGDNGILPARFVLENNRYKTWSAKVHYHPTLLWLAPYLGLDTQYALDVLALLGSFLAFTGFVSQKFCTVPLFAGLWSLYFSLYQIGQIFVTSQWDSLLLEVGFLCLMVAPFFPGRRRGPKKFPSDSINLWLVRWLLFRFNVTTGVPKLMSGCPKWWNLGALSEHFELMPLPNPLSWYSHHLPDWSLRLTTVLALVSDILIPFMYFVPIRCVRISAYLVQLFMQICIILTGNFNFVNLLVITLLLSLLDDKFFFGRSRFFNDKWSNFFGQLANILIHGILMYTAIVLFNIKVNGLQIDVSIGFTKDQYNMVIKQGVLVATYVGLASLAVTIARNISVAIMESPGLWSKLFHLLGTLFYASMATLIFILSTVPLSSLHHATNATISPTLRTMHHRLSKLHIVNNHGVFSRMPVGNGRLEIILEGSDNIEGPWQEYNFLYKPGNVNHSLPFVAPYSPRVDWQMWWAAQSTYKNEPWLLSMVHRLLHGRPEVLALFDSNHSPFHNKKPKYIRGVLYKYKYTSWAERSKPAWWKREKVDEYFPAFSKDTPALVDYLKARNLLPTPSKEVVNSIWKKWLDSIRFVTSHLEATLLLWSVFTAGCAIITTTKHK